MIENIQRAEQELEAHYRDQLVVNTDLGRQLVSFQANKQTAGNRWFKYKEGFSVPLVHYVCDYTGIKSGWILEPFAGSGTALFAASERGISATGIELLPSSAEIIRVRKCIRDMDVASVIQELQQVTEERIWEKEGLTNPFPHLRITQGAFPVETETFLGRLRYEISVAGKPEIAQLLRFAALCILEGISYTRKDGQYLRWDYRSGRTAGTRPFDKGQILPFTDAIIAKLQEIAADLRYQNAAPIPKDLFTPLEPEVSPGEIEILEGSCLHLLPQWEQPRFNGIITSPPYANRYDYTRTYALELAMLGVSEEQIRFLRQTMLSCTVENREKTDLHQIIPPDLYQKAQRVFAEQELLQGILLYLDQCKAEGTLNNTGIPRMLRGYFWEMCLVIFLCSRVLKPNAPFIMVNDNVRYQGIHIPVDLILSDFARAAGLLVEQIWVLPTGKGNSSQQMGVHGRTELRKCVYLWRKRAC
ncbi:MAG: hypothetical protein OHK0029_26470 [Armatimonadaceae bacterium]